MPNIGSNIIYATTNRGLLYQGNQLQKVDNGINHFISYGSELFKDYDNHIVIPTEYAYDTNGNMLYDANGGVSAIQYNLLNLPDKIHFTAGHKNLYTYDAGGHKLRTVNYSSNRILDIPMGTITPLSSTPSDYTVLTTDYVGNIIYENGALKEILLPEGYYKNGTYYYYLKDHLGNTRVVVNNAGSVVEKSHYYPSGTRFFPESTSDNSVLAYRYNGKEMETMNGLNQMDYGARRRFSWGPIWTGPDDLREKYYSISPYIYCLNNPVKLIDPDGRAVIAADPNAIRNIVNTLNKDESQYVRFDNKGLLDVSLLSQSKSTSENFTALSTLANSETNYIFAVSNQDVNGSKFFEKGSDANNPNNFSYGVTNLPGAENDPSPDNNVYINTASFLDEKTQARNTAHEGYGHAYFFELKKSDESINPSHTKGVVGTGTEYDSYTKKNVQYFIFGNTNKKLEEQIKKVEQQAIKNYEEKKP